MKIQILTIIILFFSIPVVFSAINFYGPEQISISGTTFGYSASRLKALPFNNSWYIGMETDHFAITGACRISKFDNNLTTREYGWTNFLEGQLSLPVEIADWYLFPTNAYSGKNIIEYLGSGDGGIYETYGNTSLQDLTMGYIRRENLAAGFNEISYANNGAVVWKYSSIWYYAYPFNYPLFSTGGNGTLSIPTAYSDLADAYLFWDIKNSQYILLGTTTPTDTYSAVVILYYDANFNYKAASLMADSSYSYIYPKIFKESNNDYLMTYVLSNYPGVSNGNNSIVFRQLDFYYTGFNDVYTEYILPTNAYNVSGDKWVNDTWAVYDQNFNYKLLFYNLVNKTSFVGLYVLKENVGCLCSGWINSNQCIDKLRMQTRTCYPSNCNSTTQYVTSEYCDKQFNETHGILPQGYSQISGSSFCDSGLIDHSEGLIAKCESYLKIPDNCTNVRTNATAKMKVYASDALWPWSRNTNHFTFDICNPVTSCVSYLNYTCEDAYYDNLTFSKGYGNYIGGDTATYGFQLLASMCIETSNFWGYEGWIKYGIEGTLYYICDLPCGGQKCTREGLVEYSTQQLINCEYNETTKIKCDYGCDQATGICKTQVQAAGGTITDQGISSVFSIFKYLFSPTTVFEKLICSLIWSTVSGIAGLAILKGLLKNESIQPVPMFIIFFAIPVIYFLMIGYIPIILIIILIGFIIMGFYLKNAGG